MKTGQDVLLSMNAFLEWNESGDDPHPGNNTGITGFVRI
jgi:hypothetical protein